MPSFRFLPATFIGGNKSNTFQVLREHTLYDCQVAAQLTYKRTGVLIRPSGLGVEDREVRHLGEHSAQQQRPIGFPPHVLPRRCRRSMATIVAPWISSNGAKMGVFCQMCLYTAEQESLYTPADFFEHLEFCRVATFDNSTMLIQFMQSMCPHLTLAMA